MPHTLAEEGGLTRGDNAQVLPFASEATLSRLEANIGSAGAVTDMLHAGAAPADIAAKLLDGLGTSPGLSLVPRSAPCCLADPSALCTHDVAVGSQP